VRCRLRETEKAAADFSSWVHSHPNFAHCTYLALFQFREGRTNEALAAVRLALQQPFVEPIGTDGNKFYLGQNDALIAYEAGEFDLTLAVCDKLLSDPHQEDWWKRNILRIKAALTLMRGNQIAATSEMQHAIASRRHDTFSEEPQVKADDELLAAIKGGDTEYVRSLANWIDDGDKWFSPFEIDETGTHGVANVPNPYPASWKSDQMTHKSRF
jgi:hypothetical protein